MQYYFAPMEGITGYIYRNVHHSFFPGMDKYFSPFISPGTKKTMTPKELRDILPENNQGYPLIPQILTNRSEDFEIMPGSERIWIQRGQSESGMSFWNCSF